MSADTKRRTAAREQKLSCVAALGVRVWKNQMKYSMHECVHLQTKALTWIKGEHHHQQTIYQMSRFLCASEQTLLAGYLVILFLRSNMVFE